MERVELYCYVTPTRTKIPISMQLFQVDDLVPTEDELEWLVTQLCNHRSGGSSGMRAEHLKRWLATAQKAKKAETEATTTARVVMKENNGTKEVQSDTEADNWTMVIDLV